MESPAPKPKAEVKPAVKAAAKPVVKTTMKPLKKGALKPIPSKNGASKKKALAKKR